MRDRVLAGERVAIDARELRLEIPQPAALLLALGRPDLAEAVIEAPVAERGSGFGVVDEMLFGELVSDLNDLARRDYRISSMSGEMSRPERS